MRSLIESDDSSNETGDEHAGDAKSDGARLPGTAISGIVAPTGRRHFLATVGSVGLAASLSGYVETDGKSGPDIDSLTVIDDSNPAWERYQVQWDVSSEDADLETVRSELIHDGSVVSSEETEVDGSSASGEHEVRTMDDVDTIRVLAFDEEGRLTGRVLDVDDVETPDDEETDDNETDDNETDENNESDAENTTGTDSDGSDRMDRSPGPGALTTLATVGGTGYLLARRRRDGQR